MGIGRTLASIVLAGAVAFGLAGKVKSAPYFENFDNPDAVNSLVVSDPSKFYQTTFEGESVMRFETGNGNYAYKNVSYPNNAPFVIKWDSYIDSLNNIDVDNDRPHNVFDFGLFNSLIEYTPLANGNYFIIYTDTYGPQQFVGGSFSTHGGGSGVEDFTNKWIHNIITYNPEDRMTITFYEGKGNESGTPYSSTYLSKEYYRNDPGVPAFANFKLEDVDKLGIRWFGKEIAEQGYSTGYIDNVYFEVIPEPASLSLLALGGLSILANRRKTKVE